MNKVMLNKLIPIKVWILIAECVQKFNIYNGNEKEKEKNLITLIKFLKQKNYNLDKKDGKLIINAIYDINCDNNYIKNIINLTDKNTKTTILKSAFTDGNFNIRKWESNGYKYYSIINLESANYVIIKTMYIDENRLVNVEAYLKDFNGNYPNKSEIRKFRQAKLLKVKEDLYKEKFDVLNRDEISCKTKMNLKLGKKQKKNQYYYEIY